MAVRSTQGQNRAVRSTQRGEGGVTLTIGKHLLEFRNIQELLN